MRAAKRNKGMLPALSARQPPCAHAANPVLITPLHTSLPLHELAPVLALLGHVVIEEVVSQELQWVFRPEDQAHAAGKTQTTTSGTWTVDASRGGCMPWTVGAFPPRCSIFIFTHH